MSDRKQYNGLRGTDRGSVPAFGGQVHDISGGRDRDAAIQAAFAQQMQALMRETYVRAASMMMLDGSWPEAENYRQLAEQCQIAALAYFEGLGLIRKPEQPAADSSLAEAIDTEQKADA